MSSGYRGILEYDRVIRLLPDSSTTEGILLPPFPVGVPMEDLRLIKPLADWIWVNLWSLTTLWVEFYNGAFLLHAIDIPALHTQNVMMMPDEVFRLAIEDGIIYLRNNLELKEEALSSKLPSLKKLANSYVDKARSIFGGFMGASISQADYLLAVGTAYNTHLTILLSLTTYQEIQQYNIMTGWPL